MSRKIRKIAEKSCQQDLPRQTIIDYPCPMSKGRLEAFSDGVIAILITIMVLELKVPEGADLAALNALTPKFLSYLLSFVFLGIYWNNHHHLLQAAKHVNGSILWANLHLLFWLSLIPLVTAWMGEHTSAELPVALYGVVMWMSGIAYYILTQTLISHHGNDSVLSTALGRRIKEITSLLCYTMAILFSFIYTWIAVSLYVFVACMWLVPDRRVERVLNR